MIAGRKLAKPIQSKGNIIKVIMCSANMQRFKGGKQTFQIPGDLSTRGRYVG